MTEVGRGELYPDWLPEYRAALLELNPILLKQKVEVAQKAISARMEVLARDHGGTPEERQAITDALNSLAI